MKSNKENDEDKALELDNANFVVSREEYEQFSAALDEPPKSIPALRQLFSEEIAFDKNQ